MDEPLLLKDVEEKSLYEQYIYHNWENPKKQRLFFIRVVGMFIILLTIMVFPLINNQPLTSSDCMVDQFFLLTDRINVYFYENRAVKNLIVIVAGFFLDVALLIYLVDYMVWGRSWRGLIFGFLFYSVRANLENITVLGFPKGYIWEFPGIYSMLVTYVRSSDFFYSGHVGAMMFLALEFNHLGKKYLMYFAAFCCVFEGTLMVIVRCHYSVDIIGGIIATHYFWMLSLLLSKYADRVGYKQFIN